MLILKNKNVLEIVSHMLNFEHNYTIYKFNESSKSSESGENDENGEDGEDGEDGNLCMSHDVKPYPIITAKGGKKIHYKATCGIIYYNITDSELYSPKVIELVKKIYDIMSTNEDHLLVERATAVTGSCIVKQNIFTNGTFIIKTKKPYMISKKNINKFPARALIILPNNYRITYNNYPPHYSTRASFTWYFMPIQYNLWIDGISCGMGLVNALTSSIYLDIENNIKYNHNDVTNNIKYEDSVLINTINIELLINDKFIIFENSGENMLLCIGKQRIPAYRMYKKKIYTYNDVEYVNNEKKCNSCDNDVSDFSVGVVLEYNNIIPMVSLFCFYCCPLNNKSCFIFSSNIVKINKIRSNIFEISQSNFIKSLSDQYTDTITHELSKFPPTYNILFTNSNIQDITNLNINISQYIMIKLNFDILNV
jgi:hypothetical protein